MSPVGPQVMTSHGSFRCTPSGSLPGWPATPRRHENLALGAELEDLVADLVVALRVGDPDVAVVVDVDPVRQHEEPRAELGHQLARVPVVLQDRIQGRVGRAAAGEPDSAATVVDPDVPVGRIDVDARRSSPTSARRAAWPSATRPRDWGSAARAAPGRPLPPGPPRRRRRAPRPTEPAGPRLQLSRRSVDSPSLSLSSVESGAYILAESGARGADSQAGSVGRAIGASGDDFRGRSLRRRTQRSEYCGEGFRAGGTVADHRARRRVRRHQARGIWTEMATLTEEPRSPGGTHPLERRGGVDSGCRTRNPCTTRNAAVPAPPPSPRWR